MGPHPVGADEGDEDPELGGGAEEEGHGVGEERPEVRQRPYPQEDDDGIDLVLGAEVDVAQEAHGSLGIGHDPGEGQVDQKT